MRKYVELPASMIDTIDFSEVLQDSADTVRWSDDKSTFFVKFEEGNVPDFIGDRTQHSRADYRGNSELRGRYAKEENYKYKRGSYALSTDASEEMEEGNQINFTINSPSNRTGEEIPYKITGVTEDDIDIPLEGTIIVPESKSVTISINLIDDSSADPETLVFEIAGQSTSISVQDIVTGSPIENGIVYEKSIELDGANDYLRYMRRSNADYPTISNGASLSTIDRITTHEPLSFNAWVRFLPSGESSQQQFIMFWSPNNSYVKFYMQPSTQWSYMYAWYKQQPENKYRYTRRQIHSSWGVPRFDANFHDVFHMITYTKSTGNDLSDYKMYINGFEITTGVYNAGNIETLTDQTATNESGINREIQFGAGGADFRWGEMQFYDKELTPAEIAELYDGSGAEGGVGNQNAQAKSTNTNLVHHWYYDEAVDTYPNVQDKKSDLHLELVNSAGSDFAFNVNTINFESFEVDNIPAQHISSDVMTINVTSRNPGSTITWYTDSSKSTLLHEGDSYQTTCEELGARTLYVEENINGKTQFAEREWEVVPLCNATHSINMGYNKLSVATDANNYLPPLTDGSFTFVWDLSKDPSVMTNSGSWNATLMMGNIRLMMIPYGTYWLMSWYVNGAYEHKYFHIQTNPKPGLVNEEWHQYMVTHNGTTGETVLYIDGNREIAIIHSTSITSPMVGESVSFTLPRVGKYSDVAIYDAALTDAQAAEHYNGGTPADLSGMSSWQNVIDWWKMGDNDDPVASRFLTSEASGRALYISGTQIPLDEVKTTDRP
jgi:hypothetical protein